MKLYKNDLFEIGFTGDDYLTKHLQETGVFIYLTESDYVDGIELVDLIKKIDDDCADELKNRLWEAKSGEYL